MSLNNWLCKHFKDEDREYVTLVDIIWKICTVIFSDYARFCYLNILMFIGVSLFAGAAISGHFFSSDFKPTIFDTLSDIFIGFGAFAAIAIIVYLLYKLSQVKVAKCKRTEKEGFEKP